MAENGAFPVATALTFRSSQSGVNRRPRSARTVEVAPHRRPRICPLGADSGQCEIALRQLGAPGVDAVEDVDDDIDGLVNAGDGLDVEDALEDVAQQLHPVDVLGKPLLRVRVRAEHGVGRVRAVDEQ